MMRRTFAVAALTVGGLVTAAAPAHADHSATIAEFPTPSANSLPQGIDVTPGGDVWYAETTAGKIALQRGTQSIREFPLPNGGLPNIVKAVPGEHGGTSVVWFSDGKNAALGTLNPTSGAITEYPVPSGAAPFFIQLGNDGSVWFSETTGVGRRAANGTFSEWNVTLEHPDDNIEEISLDQRGNLFFAERNFDGAGAAGTNKVRRLNPNTNVISTYLVPTFGGNPAGVLARHGVVFVSEYFANNIAVLFPEIAQHTNEVVLPNQPHAAVVHSAAVANRSPREHDHGGLGGVPVTGVTHNVTPIIYHDPVHVGWIEYPLPTVNANAEDMRLGDDGHLFFEEDFGNLGVLDLFRSRITEYGIPSPNSGYYNISLSNNGLWFTEAGIFGPPNAPVPTKIGVLQTGN